MSTLAATDAFVVNRAGVNYQVTAANLMSTIADTDLFVVNRSAVNYQVTGLDVKAYFGGGGGGVGGLFRDSSLGITYSVWSPGSSITTLGTVRTSTCAVDPVSGTCITLGQDGIARSTDFTNWTLVYNFVGDKGGTKEQNVIPLGQGKWFAFVGSPAVTTGVLWKVSTDDGLTWADAPQMSNTDVIYGGDGAGNMIFNTRYSTDLGLSSVSIVYPSSGSGFTWRGAGAAYDGAATKWIGFSSRSYALPGGNQYQILTSSDGITFTTASTAVSSLFNANQLFTAVVTNWTTPKVSLIVQNMSGSDNNVLIISFKADTDTVVQNQSLTGSDYGGERFYLSAVQPTSDPDGNYVGSISVDTSTIFPQQPWIGAGAFGSSLAMYWGAGTIVSTGVAAIKNGVIVTNNKATNVSPY